MCFEDEERITVGSSAYNLAGDVARRGNFLKNNILSLIFSGISKNGMGDGIVDAHLAGPATSLIRFFKWAETSGYNTQVGDMGGLIYSAGALSEAGFQYLVPVKATHSQRAISHTIGAIDLHLIAFEWILNNTPDNRDLAFTATLEKIGLSLTGKILIHYTVSGSEVSFTPSYNLNNNMPFFYLYHEEREIAVPVVTDTGWITLTPPDTPPSRASFVNGTISVIQDGITVPATVVASGSPVTVVETVPRTRTTTTVTTYSNSTPTDTVVTTDTLNLSFDKITGTYTKVTTVTATPTVKESVTTLVQNEESFYNTLYADTVSSSSSVITQTSTTSFGVTPDVKIDSVGAVIAAVGSSVAGPIPISVGETLVASHAPGAGGYNGFADSGGVPIAGSLTTSTTLVYTSGAVNAYFTYPSATVGFTITRYSPVTQTITITTNTPSLETYWKYKQVTTLVKQDKWLPYLLKIYQKGSSGTGDSLLFNPPAVAQKLFPVIPLRRDNVMVDLANFPTQYGWNRKATRKAFGSKKKYNDLIDSLADNPSLGDIDHAWVVFGVSLSTKQQDGIRYLYEFFEDLANNTVSTVGAYKSPSSYESAWAAFVIAAQATTNDEFGAEITARPMPPTVQEYTFAINASGGTQDWLFNTTITAKGGGQVVGTGFHARSNGKVGNSWLYAKSTVTLSVPTFNNDGGTVYSPSVTTVIAFGKQVTTDNWVEYEFFDLTHINNVYQGITATTLATTVIASTDENSSFIIPLSENVLKDLTLIRRTQLSLECSFLVVNYYDKQTIPWYATGFFQIVLVVVIIVVAVYTGYIGPESAGVFGTNAAVGASIGFTGTAAIVAGAIVNAVGAAIVAGMITNAAIRAFGQEFGQVVGFIASAIAINAMSSNGPFSLANTWTEMTKADNLIRMSMSGIQQYGNYMQSQAMKLNAETQALLEETNTALKEINLLMQELLGDTGVDAKTITDAMRYAAETPSQFLSRTTMTGNEIAEISIKLVEDFPAPQLALPYLDQ